MITALALIQNLSLALAQCKWAYVVQQLDLVFYGDSIAETWRGTDMGRDCWRCKGGPDIFQKYFGSRYTSKIFAVGGKPALEIWSYLCHAEDLQCQFA